MRISKMWYCGANPECFLCNISPVTCVSQKRVHCGRVRKLCHLFPLMENLSHRSHIIVFEKSHGKDTH